MEVGHLKTTEKRLLSSYLWALRDIDELKLANITIKWIKGNVYFPFMRELHIKYWQYLQKQKAYYQSKWNQTIMLDIHDSVKHWCISTIQLLFFSLHTDNYKEDYKAHKLQIE